MQCCNCKNKATTKFGNDPDLIGVHSCEDCKEKVRLALLLSSVMGSDSFEKYLKKQNK